MVEYTKVELKNKEAAFNNIQNLTEKLRKVEKGVSGDLVIDMSLVNKISSYTISIFVHFSELLKKNKKGNLVLTDVQERVYETINSFKVLPDLIHVYDTIEDYKKDIQEQLTQ